jgi:hypothetical protein
MSTPQFISRDDARALVGKMLFGSDWIVKLTKEQSQLLSSEFGPKRRAVFQSGVLVSTIDVYERPCPPELRDKFNAAVGYSERMRIQGTTVDDWIETVAGLECAKPFFNRANLNEAMKRHGELHREGGTGSARHRGPEPVERNRVAKGMRDMIAAGKLTLPALADLKEEAMVEMFSAGSRETARNARDLLLSESAASEAATTPTNTDIQAE